MLSESLLGYIFQFISPVTSFSSHHPPLLGPGSEERGPAAPDPHHGDLRADLPHGRGRQRGRLPCHREEQVDAHGHQLLPLLARRLRSHDTRAR